MPRAKANVRTIPHEGGWANEREGAKRVAKIFATKAAAKAKAVPRRSGRRSST